MVHPSPFLDPAFGNPYRYRHQKRRNIVRDIVLPSRKILRRSASPSPRYLSEHKKNPT